MQPSEFWALPVADWWCEFDAHLVEARRMEGKMAEARGGKAKGSSFSPDQWDRARKEHAAKMRAKK